MNGRDGFFIGVAQALALVPGVSRSGATISAGLLRGFDRVAAARYSFLLSVPAVVLSGLFELRKVGEDGSPSVGGDRDRDPRRLRLRLRRDRLAAALPHAPTRCAIFVIYRSPWARWCWSSPRPVRSARPLQKERTARGSGPFAVTREESREYECRAVPAARGEHPENR